MLAAVPMSACSGALLAQEGTGASPCFLSSFVGSRMEGQPKRLCGECDHLACSPAAFTG
jgi:hypothetical protein